MKVIIRVLIGLVLFLAGMGAAGVGGLRLYEATTAEKETRSRGGASERTYAVAAGVIENGPVRPEITAYGEIRSWRTLEIRAALGGRIVELADRFRDGVEVDEGDLFFRIDEKDYAAAAADARAALAEAEADLMEAEQSLEVTRRELAAADAQRDLRQTALKRQQDLRGRGVATSSVVEEAEMALASAEQTAASRAQMMVTAGVKIDRGLLRVERARIALAEAERELADTEHRAPFPGLLTDVTAVLGKLASPSEQLGALIDPKALEAAFRLTNAQFARLLDEDGALRPIDVAVTLELDDVPLTLEGVIDRPGAVVAAGETGRLVYARLNLERATLLRPGDFVTVTIAEPALPNVARVPSAAVNEAGELLIISDEDRLTAATTRILRRVGDDVIIAGAPEGARYVQERSPQLGSGVKVKVIDNDAPAVSGAPDAGPSRPALVKLAPDQQKRMIEFVESNQRMPSEAKQRVLARLRTGEAPQEMIDRLTRRMGG